MTPFKLRFIPDASAIYVEEFHWIRRGLDGHAEWAALDDGDAAWAHIVPPAERETMTFKLLDGAFLSATPNAIAYDVDFNNRNHWRNRLRAAAFRFRTGFHHYELCSMGEKALVLMRRDSAIVLRAEPGKTHYYLPAPDVTAHDVLEAQVELDRDFPGSFILESL